MMVMVMVVMMKMVMMAPPKYLPLLFAGSMYITHLILVTVL